MRAVTTDPVLTVRGLAAGYGDRAVIDRIDLDLVAGRTLAIVGPSGCGKSTLLLALAGLLQPRAGSVHLHGLPLAGGDRRIGLVLQHYGLFPWFTVLRNAAIGLEIAGRLRRERGPDRACTLDRVRAMLARLGLADREASYPRELSGGEQQRLALARTLLLDPEVLLLDEPFSALDALTREELQDLLLEMLDGRATATVLVTHSIDEAVYLGDRVGVLAPSLGARTTDPGARNAGSGTGPAAAARLETDANPAGRRGADRAGTAYHEACRRQRLRFREAVRA